MSEKTRQLKLIEDFQYRRVARGIIASTEFRRAKFSFRSNFTFIYLDGEIISIQPGRTQTPNTEAYRAINKAYE